MAKSRSGFVPKPYRVFVSFLPEGKTEWVTQRFGGGYDTVEAAEEAIKKEKQDLKTFDHTYGGLLPHFKDPRREYSIWKANWSPVKTLK